MLWALLGPFRTEHLPWGDSRQSMVCVTDHAVPLLYDILELGACADALAERDWFGTLRLGHAVGRLLRSNVPYVSHALSSVGMMA